MAKTCSVLRIWQVVILTFEFWYAIIYHVPYSHVPLPLRFQFRNTPQECFNFIVICMSVR